MRLRPVTKLDKKNKTASKKFHHDVMSANCDIIFPILFPSFFFSICGKFRAIWKPDSGRIVCKTYIFINSNILSYILFHFVLSYIILFHRTPKKPYTTIKFCHSNNSQGKDLTVFFKMGLLRPISMLSLINKSILLEFFDKMGKSLKFMLLSRDNA